VGRVGVSDESQLLIEHWNGTTWRIKQAEQPSGSLNSFSSVSCANATRCAAVGYSAADGGAFIEMWDGSTWSITPSTNPGSAGNLYAGVSCPSRRRCVAAGYFSHSGARFHRDENLIESWHGSVWTRTRAESPVPTNDYVQGVDCPTTTWCVAVSFAFDRRGTTYHGVVLSGRP
jgi:hypothetical protein